MTQTVPTCFEVPSAIPPFRGIIEVPNRARSIIVFAHGHDSSHLNPRNRLIARTLLQRGFAVLLPDLTDLSVRTRAANHGHQREDILQSANRLIAIIDWLADNPATKGLRVGLFGARTGAASAMVAAALRPARIHAVVSLGGRPDLAEDDLLELRTPTLMLVGSQDKALIDHNRKAGEKMRRKPMLELIHGTTHRFSEPGKLEQVASISNLWFQRTLAACG